MDGGSSGLEGLSASFAQTFTSLVEWALSWWVGGDDPGLGALRGAVMAIRPVTSWAVAAALAVSVVIAGGMLLIRRNGQDLAGLLLGLGRSVLVFSAGWLILASCWTLSDAVARWLIGGRPDAAAYVESVMNATSAVDPALGLTMSIVGIGCCLSFVAAVLSRFVIAVLLAVVLPVLAAMSVVRADAFGRGLAWLVAVMAFKPLVAVVYRVCHGLLTTTDDPVVVLLVATLSFLLAALLLPATAHVVAGLRTPLAVR
jgi:hypothetical protein